MGVVYFAQQMCASHAIPWLKSSILVLKKLFHFPFSKWSVFTLGIDSSNILNYNSIFNFDFDSNFYGNNSECKLLFLT